MKIFLKIIYSFISVIDSLLTLRFILIFFKANPENLFVKFIVSTSQIFVNPFRNIFIKTPDFGNYIVDMDTIAAIIVYMICAMTVVGILKGLTLDKNE